MENLTTKRKVGPFSGAFFLLFFFIFHVRWENVPQNPTAYSGPDPTVQHCTMYDGVQGHIPPIALMHFICTMGFSVYGEKIYGVLNLISKSHCTTPYKCMVCPGSSAPTSEEETAESAYTKTFCLVHF